MNKTQKIIVFIVGCIAVGSLVWWYVVLQSASSNIDSYEKCAAKYPVMDSYPERCQVPGGSTYTKQY